VRILVRWVEQLLGLWQLDEGEEGRKRGLEIPNGTGEAPRRPHSCEQQRTMAQGSQWESKQIPIGRPQRLAMEVHRRGCGW